MHLSPPAKPPGGVVHSHGLEAVLLTRQARCPKGLPLMATMVGPGACKGPHEGIPYLGNTYMPYLEPV